MPELALRVTAIRDLAPRIRAFRLEDANGRELPSASPGSHIDLDLPLPAVDRRRSYSIVSCADTRDHYEIAVLRDERGRGGSVFMHERVRVGDVLSCSVPRNTFPLAKDAASHLLVSGGIGITPILSMIRHLERAGAEYEAHCCARAPELMPYLDQLIAIAGAKAHVYFDGGDPARGLDLVRLLAVPRAGRHLYVCGPSCMNEAAVEIAAQSGWPADAVHLENFAPPPPRAQDREIEIVLARSGRTLIVPACKTILDALIEAGEDPIYDCKAGNCGVCATRVIEGIAEHRDNVLSEAEREGSREMCICVSRAVTARLMLDL